MAGNGSAKKLSNEDIQSIKYKIDLLYNKMIDDEKPGFFKKWFGRVDNYVESKIGSEEENDQRKRRWTSWSEIEEAFGDNLTPELSTKLNQIFERVNRLNEHEFVRNSAVLHSKRPDRELEESFLQIRDLFDRYVECVYIICFGESEKTSAMAREFCVQIDMLVKKYEETIHAMIIDRLTRERKDREKLKLTLDSLLGDC